MMFRLTPAVKVLVILNIAVFIVQHTVDTYLGGNYTGWLGLVPSAVVMKLWIWQLFTYSFLHADVLHLFLNMLMIVFIGSELESGWGIVRFLKYYFFCSIAAGILYLFFQAFIQSGIHTPMVGASGGIYGLLTAYGILFGERTLLFMLIFPMKAKQFIWILAGMEFLSSFFSPSGGVSSVAHLSGMGAGFVYLWGRAYWIARQRMKVILKSLPLREGGAASKAKTSKTSHLKLVIDNEEDSKTWH